MAKLTQEELINRYSLMHPDYDFSESVFNGVKRKIRIKCREHGYFEKIPSNLKYSGCPKCGYKRTGDKLRKDLDLAMYNISSKAPHIFFDKDSYKGINSKINCICPDHGFFSKKYSTMIRHESFCPRCVFVSKEKKLLKQNKYIEKLKARKHDNLDEEKTTYTKNSEHAKAYCKKHGYFNKIADDLLRDGCTKCNLEKKRMGFSVFLSRALAAHGNKYQYHKNTWIDFYNKVKISCSIHGDFWQNPVKHTKSKQGCPSCATFGYTRGDFVKKAEQINNGFGVLYIIKCFNDSESFYKVGVTTRDVKSRFVKKAMPYKYSIIDYVELKASDTYSKEKELIRSLFRFKYEPKIKFGGSARECFSKVYFRGKIYE